MKEDEGYIILRNWFAGIILVSTLFMVYTGINWLSPMVILLWIASAVIILKKIEIKKEEKEKRYRIILFLLGFGVLVFSVVNIPLGFGNPPFTVGDLAITLSGFTIIFLAYFGYYSIILPASLPLMAILGFQIYDLFHDNIEVIATPLIPLTTACTVLSFQLLGVNVDSQANIITIMTKNGDPLSLSIVADCSGIYSLGAFGVVALLALITYRRVNLREGLVLSVGFIGTYVFNLLRVILISFVAYYYGWSDKAESAHTHIGWILFGIWMFIFWYFIYPKYSRD